MKCKECGKLYGNMKDDGVIVNPHLGELCIDCWGKDRPPLEGIRAGSGYVFMEDKLE